MTDKRICFIGAGRWAVALALHCDRVGLEASLYEPASDYFSRLCSARRHPDLPESCAIPAGVNLTTDLAAALGGTGMVVYAIPSAAFAEAARQYAPAVRSERRTVVTVTKGIDPATRHRLSRPLVESLPGLPVVVLAGPAIPWDFALGDPTTLVAASEDEAAARAAAGRLTGASLRVYYSADVAGVEIAAALKNVIAIAAGIADGLKLGINARAALLARGLAEMTRLGIAQNANPMTFAGLAGIGDLIVTSFSPNSRNHRLGELIASGLTLKQAQSRLNGVAEGATTALTARALAARAGIEMPVTEEVCRILYESAPVADSLKRLFARPPKKEVY